MSAAPFPLNIFEEMWLGSQTAWVAFGLMIATVGLAVLFIIVWWKMPEPAKKLFLNNLIGHRPVIANAYDNKVMRFETPEICGEGLMHDKRSGWHFLPRLARDNNKLTVDEKTVMTDAFQIQGANGQFYVAYSGKGTIVNPSLEAVLEEQRVYGKQEAKQKTEGKNGSVFVDKKVWIAALQKMKGDMVQVDPVWITSFLDPRKIKAHLSKSYSKSQLAAQEEEIAQSVQEQLGGGKMKIVLVLGVITLVAVVAVAAKVYQVF